MQLVEHDGKRLLESLGIHVPERVFVAFADTEIPLLSGDGPWYVKAQVLEGHRGDRGLVKRLDRVEDVPTVIASIREALQDMPCAGFLIESGFAHESEWLVSVDIDAQTGVIMAHWSATGGQRVATLESATFAELQARVDLPAPVRETLIALAQAMPASDAISIEINPLAITNDGRAMALDAKIELDSAAIVRHPEWSSWAELSRVGACRSTRERAYIDLFADRGGVAIGRYVELDGDVAMILSGGGASLVAMDALALAGGRPANYVELSGNPDPELLRKAAVIAFTHPRIKAVWIAGSYANFTDIYATVEATLAAYVDVGLTLPVVIRRDGPRAQEAEEMAHAWAKEHGVTLVFHRGDTDLLTSAKEVCRLQNII